MNDTRFVQIERREKFSQEEFYPLVSAMYEEIWLNLLPPQLVNEDLPTKVSKNIVTPADAAIPDCVTCGACCGAMICVAVSPPDTTDAEHFWDITTTGERRGEIVVDRFLRRSGETLACQNLGGIIGERVGCQIYEERPQMCRVFEAGSDKCHALRRAYGIEPFLDVTEMMAALQKLKARDAETISEDTIRDVQIAEKTGTDFLEITALMPNGTMQPIHVYDPQIETWRQYQFSGLTLAQAQTLIASRNGTAQSV